jgi:4-aminobutyrate aminotransferase/(S)-3-amino-2-methylpropionate transaminase
MIDALVNRPATGNYPSQDWLHTLKDGLLKVAPPGLDKITTASSGSEANEVAYKAAFMLHQRLKRGKGVEWTEEETMSSMNNSAPGSPDLAILSFRGSFHGRGIGALATTRSKAVHKMDIPTFDWPQAKFPTLRYPLDAYAAENAAEEQKCLEEVEHLIRTWRFPVAGLIIEPIQSEGGDNHASPAFFRGLRDITQKHGVTMIVDEVQTGQWLSGMIKHPLLIINHRLWSDWQVLGARALGPGDSAGHRDLLEESAIRWFLLSQP